MKTSRVLATITSAASGLYLASGAFAASSASDYLDNINEGVDNGTDLMDLIYSLINWAIGIAALVCVVILIVSGYRYITSSGDETKIQDATRSLTYAIIGLVICFIAVILVQFVLKSILKV